VRLDTASTALRYTRRRLKDADVYLFFNESAGDFSHSVTVRSDGRRVERWDPRTGKIMPVPATGRNGSMKILLSLKPYETNIFVVR
jgi:hypothetical protein